MSIKVLIRESIFYAILQAVNFQLKLITVFFKSVIKDTNFTIRFISFLYSESKNKKNKRLLEGSFISIMPLSLFVNFKSFLNNFIGSKKRFKYKTQNPPLFYSNFLSSKPWYHSNEASDETDLEVEKVKTQLKAMILILVCLKNF